MSIRTRSADGKRELLEGGAAVFSGNSTRQLREQEALQVEPYEQIRRLELEWLKKSWLSQLRPSVP